MDRRNLIVLLGAVAALPLGARGQQKPMPVVGFLGNGPPDTSVWIVDAIRQGLKDAGFVEGRNVVIEYRWAEGRYDRLPALATQLVDRKADVIFASGPGIEVAKTAASGIPIVFFGGGDLVASGLIASLAHPGGNLTGVSIVDRELDLKRFQLASELVPTPALIAMLLNPDYSSSKTFERNMAEAARDDGRQLSILKASTESEIDAAFESLVQLHAGVLVVGSDPFFSSRRDQIVALAARDAIPAIHEWREAPDAGGLISYGPNRGATMRQAGVYIGLILAGAKPADLPIQRPSRFELVINLKAAKTLGLTIPPSILARADEVIE